MNEKEISDYKLDYESFFALDLKSAGRPWWGGTILLILIFYYTFIKDCRSEPRVKRPFQSSKLPCRIYLCPVSRACMFCASQTNQISEQARESWARARAGLDK